MNIKVYNNFLSEQEISDLLEYSKRSEMEWGKADVQFWDGRFIHNKDIKEYEISSLLIEKREQIKGIIKEDFNVDENLYSDMLQIVRWTSGYELHPHADSENPDNSPHPFSYREYAAVIYLNDNFCGGEIYFPDKDNFEPKIKPGMLVLFPGTLEYLHGVKEVTEGIRYTIASFFTRDRSKSDGQERSQV